MLKLDRIELILRFNKTKISNFLGLNRGTFRTNVNNGNDYIVIGDDVYKKVSKINKDAVSSDEIEQLKLREQFEFECGLR